MAKRKTKVKRIYVKAKTKARKTLKRGYDSRTLKGVAMGSAIYGAVRNDLSDMTSQIAGNIPVLGNIVGTFGDEALLGIGGYFLAKKSKHKLLKNIGLSAMAIEASRAGEAIRNNGLSFGNTSSKTTNTNSIF